MILFLLCHAFINNYLYEKKEGTYFCKKCETAIFSSNDKYDSGSGFPSFRKPISPEKIYYLEDWDLSFKRYKILCRDCHTPLGHVFNDGPPPKGLRYTIKSSTLIFGERLYSDK